MNLLNDWRYLWIDLETTGLDPNKHCVIELAAIMTERDLTEDFRVHDVITPTRPDCWDPVAHRMHEKSGLLAELESGKDRDYYRAQNDLLAWIERIEPKKPIILAGRGVHFDRAFLETWGSSLLNHVHHRHLDVRAIQAFMEDAGLVAPEDGSTKSQHRAMADVEQSIQQYKTYLELVKRKPTSGA